MHTVYIGAGSNLGDRLENLRRAAKLLGESKDTELIKVSKIYETEPWGYADQGRFLNCVFEM
ncbi:MAG: 2-amino-4-hydroxy-6-hydroxymethyldihydropteridine diphosphokinase, partial [Spirochaetales bacterium]